MKVSLRPVLPTVYLIAGQLCYAIAINAFFAPNNIAGGGMAGIATMLNALFTLPIGLMTFLLCLPFLAVSFILKGSSYTLRTLLSTVVNAVAVDALSWLPSITDDRLTAALSGGVFYALGAVIMIKAECSSGGTDLIARLMQHLRPGVSLGKCILLVDGACVLIAALGYGAAEAALFSMIAVFVASSFTDKLAGGLQNACAFQIITKQAALPLCSEIQTRLRRGVTRQTGEGMYAKHQLYILLVVVKSREVFRLKSIVAEYDPEAFVVVTPVNEVKGGGFQNPSGAYNLPPNAPTPD